MITASEIITELWPYIADDDTVLSAITGSVYREARPDDSMANDIVIQSNGNNNGQIQEIYISILVFARNIKGGQPDEDTLDSADSAIIAAIEALDTLVFSVQVTGVTRVPDNDRPGWWLSIIRLMFNVYNESLKP